MTEQLPSKELNELEQRASDFIEAHVHVPLDKQDGYHAEQLAQWLDGALDGNPRPLWLRRTFEMGSEFGAVIDYCMVTPEDVLVYGTLDMDDRSISVLLPSEDGTGEPVQVVSEPSDLEAVGRAIVLVEESINS